jgi:hypothetical protein
MLFPYLIFNGSVVFIIKHKSRYIPLKTSKRNPQPNYSSFTCLFQQHTLSELYSYSRYPIQWIYQWLIPSHLYKLSHLCPFPILCYKNLLALYKTNEMLPPLWNLSTGSRTKWLKYWLWELDMSLNFNSITLRSIILVII